MGGWTHGWSFLALSYASVELPLLYGMIRNRASIATRLKSTLWAAPLSIAAGLGMSFVAPLMRGLGASPGGVSELLTFLSMSAALGYASGAHLARGGTDSDVHRRGAMVVDGSSATRSISKSASHSLGRSPKVPDRSVTLAGMPLSLQDETKHFKLIGTTGTGKSTAIRELLRGALGRGDRAVIADPDYGYVNRFYDAKRGDLILNPFDARSLKWDLFGEIQDAYDIDQLARSLIPDAGGSDRSWGDYSRTFFAAVTRQLHTAGSTDLSELKRLLLEASPDELRVLVRGTPAQPFLQESNSRMFDSIRSVTSSAIGPLEYVARQNAPGLSVREWVQRGSRDAAAGKPSSPHKGVLFMPYRAGQIAALRSTVSAWMRLAIFEAMNQPEGDDQRLWFVVDELDALGQIDGLKDALARLRKFGGRCVLGFQSVAQVSSTYGAGQAQTIVENCANTLILRCAASERGGTSHFASRLIGQREVMHTTVSRSRRPSEWMSSTTRSEHRSIEPAVLDSEIEQLPDLTGYLKIASAPQWNRIELSPESREEIASSRRSSTGERARAVAAQAKQIWESIRGSSKPAKEVAAARDRDAGLVEPD